MIACGIQSAGISALILISGMDSQADCPYLPYNPAMARGWESKSIEAQQADALAEPQRSRSKLTPEQARLRRKIEGLSLSRLRVLQQLEASRDPRHTQMLQQALADLDRRLYDLQSH